MLGVELDDSSHNTKRQKERGAFKNGVFEAAGLPLLRVRAARAYVASELQAPIGDLLGYGEGDFIPFVEEWEMG